MHPQIQLNAAREPFFAAQQILKTGSRPSILQLAPQLTARLWRKEIEFNRAKLTFLGERCLKLGEASSKWEIWTLPRELFLCFL